MPYRRHNTSPDVSPPQKMRRFIGSGKDCTNTNRSSSNHAYDPRPAPKAEAQHAYISSPLQATNDGLKRKTRQNQSADRKLFPPTYCSNQYLNIFNKLILSSSNSMRKSSSELHQIYTGGNFLLIFIIFLISF